MSSPPLLATLTIFAFLLVWVSMRVRGRIKNHGKIQKLLHLVRVN